MHILDTNCSAFYKHYYFLPFAVLTTKTNDMIQFAVQTLIHQNRYGDVSCVYYDVTSEKSAHLWDDVRFVGPFVGSAHLRESA